MGVEELLHILNDVLGTDVQISDPGVRDCLEYFVRESSTDDGLLEGAHSLTDGLRLVHPIHPMDFGQAYAYWRMVKHDRFEDFIRTLEVRRAADGAMRHDPVEGTYIKNALLPPRRVWDLFSNRVIPFYLIDTHDTDYIPGNIQTVSHSWCHPQNRHSVETPINGYQWPVPIPIIADNAHAPEHSDDMALLERVRVELLNVGVEYAWLDVLCIRQKGLQEHEALRVEEWKTDIPMIGRIYAADRHCVTYFNGLGLPLQLDDDTLRSETHWLNRVWTLQEGTYYWLPGGVTDTVLGSEDARTFFQETIKSSMTRDHTAAVAAIQKRHCTTELDRVHGLAYVIGCKSLPIYDPDMTPDDAWVLLLKHLRPDARQFIAVMHTQWNPDSTSFLPSFEELKMYGTRPGPDAWDTWMCDGISSIGELHQGERRPGTYIHKAQLLGELSVSQPWPGGDCLPSLNISFTTDTDKYRIYGRYLPDIKYRVISLCLQGSLVVEVLGETVIHGEIAQKVIKRGCIHWNSYIPEAPIREDDEKELVVYVPDTDAERAVYNIYE
ncbi:hypothetical protein PsYK624_122530 [Phanerochaete sordida]|uniref:Heterokaryon incompatibility domain-containing protein n=1 Tax=Phanerochaete sordida TaxID=48140 RepID=A0A9P3GM78_9APHY|nr:hypothetical protein PsYK624_122530 [Phanerochaete sordida]